MLVGCDGDESLDAAQGHAAALGEAVEAEVGGSARSSAEGRLEAGDIDLPALIEKLEEARALTVGRAVAGGGRRGGADGSDRGSRRSAEAAGAAALGGPRGRRDERCGAADRGGPAARTELGQAHGLRVSRARCSCPRTPTAAPGESPPGEGYSPAATGHSELPGPRIRFWRHDGARRYVESPFHLPTTMKTRCDTTNNSRPRRGSGSGSGAAGPGRPDREARCQAEVAVSEERRLDHRLRQGTGRGRRRAASRSSATSRGRTRLDPLAASSRRVPSRLPEFAEFGKHVVLFCHITSHIDEDPHQDLLMREGRQCLPLPRVHGLRRATSSSSTKRSGSPRRSRRPATAWSATSSSERRLQERDHRRKGASVQDPAGTRDPRVRRSRREARGAGEARGLRRGRDQR